MLTTRTNIFTFQPCLLLPLLLLCLLLLLLLPCLEGEEEDEVPNNAARVELLSLLKTLAILDFERDR